MYQTELLILAAILVVVLLVLLITRIRRERRLAAALNLMSPADFSEFLRSNSVEGTIQVVASRVSEFLKSSFGCERIVFLRKQRGHLELNYYHGIRGFGRSEFRVRFGKALITRLQQDCLPRPLEDIEDLLSDNCLAKLKQYEIDTFFPVFWRDNLYGIYFVKSSLETATATFRVLISSLAHSLAAAYHIKWHESRYERLESRSQASKGAPASSTQPSPSRQIIRLVKHRNSDSIVPKLAESLQANLGLPSALFLYDPKSKDGPPVLWRNGVNGSIAAPSRAEYDWLVRQFNHTEVLSIADLKGKGEGDHSLLGQLQAVGLTHMTRLYLTSRRSGLWAWSGGGSPQVVNRNLDGLRSQAKDLVENAESYERIEEMSYTDSLTGLANQRYFHKRLREEIDRAKRYRRSLALIIFDLDDLKSINDTYGHLAGDAVLRRLGQILRGSIRAIDVIARYGGDEFCVIMPEADKATCERFMQRLQEKISSSQFAVKEIEGDTHRTISQGGAVYPEHGDSYARLLEAADAALLRAKEEGRNRYLLYDSADQPTGV